MKLQVTRSSNPSRTSILKIAILVAVSTAVTNRASTAELLVESGTNQKQVTLSGPDSCWQLVVTERDGNQLTDATAIATYRASPNAVVTVDATGMVRPLKDGAATVSITKGKLRAEIPVRVTDVNPHSLLNFVTDVAPVFTRNQCNSGGCHGKKGGQQGFELALLGFEPELDYDRLLDRVDLDNPEESYLLQKATKVEPHEGGVRFKTGSPHYRLIHRWIAQGARRGEASDPMVTRIEVTPDNRTLPRESRQQLSVLAHMSNGTVRNITHFCQFESNAKRLADVTREGVVRLHDIAGIASIMVRYQTHVGVFRAVIPTGTKLVDLPPAGSFVDRLLFAQYETLGIPPSPVCDDRTFIRRATIDVAGRLPTPAEVTAFTDDPSSDKDTNLIERLLADDGYADYFALKWSSVLRNRRTTARQNPKPTAAFHKWIRDGLKQNKPYDQFVRNVLTATGDFNNTPPVVWYREANEMSVQLEDTSQLFLGQRLQCARCHHHPQEKWSEADYYGMAAFFSRVEVSTKNEVTVSVKGGKWEALNPKAEKPIPPTPLEQDPISGNDDPRGALVEWMTSEDNRFFPKALVNRYWKHFLGRALVEPEDDMRATNPPTNPALLDALADHFIQSGFDLKNLVRTICLSHAYRLSSEANDLNLNDTQNYSRFLPRRLLAEVLLDGIDQVTLEKSRFSNVSVETRAIQLPDNQTGSYFLNIFGRPDMGSVCECERRSDATLAQLLHLLNSREIVAKTAGKRARILARDPRPHRERIEELYQVALSRSPTEQESKALLDYLAEIESESDTDTSSASQSLESATPLPQQSSSGKNKPVTIISISASESPKPHYAQAVFDGNVGTRWSVQGKGHFLQVEFNRETDIEEIQIGVTKGIRRYRFDILASNGGRDFKQVSSFESSGKGDAVESYRLRRTKARFIRIVHQGNSSNTWSNTHTVKFPGIPVARSVRLAEIDTTISSHQDKADDQPPREGSSDPYADIIWALITTKEFMFNH